VAVTSLLDRFTAPADPEETRVTNPPPALPRGVPWWAGVHGLDPALPADDWGLAAQCTAMACAAHVFGTGAGYPAKLISRKPSPARQFLDWLLDAAGPEDAARRLALRLICERTQSADADDVLEDAGKLHASCSPGRR
jgi:hypothetical protein